MPTTFDVLFLGVGGTQIDPTEGNNVSENANLLVGLTFGSTGAPLSTKIQTLSPVGTPGTLYDTNNTAVNDQFSVNGITFTMDGIAVYTATLTYADGTTASVQIKIAQTTTGELYLVPEIAGGEAAQAVLSAKPITSMTVNTLVTNVSDGMTADRLGSGFKGRVDGTAGADLITTTSGPGGTGFTDAQGDQIDGADGINDLIDGGAGNDTIDAGLGNDTIYGGFDAGADAVYGGDGNDLIYGGAGNDYISNGAGSDTVFGGAGDDYITDVGAGNATAGPDLLYGGDGIDNIRGSTGSDTIYGGIGNDYVDAGAGNNLVYGDDGNDDLRSGAGADTLYGGLGDDYIEAGAGLNLVYGGDGNDDLRGGLDADTIYGGLGNDYVEAGAGLNLVYGGDGIDDLRGGLDADTLYGDAGDDNFLGGEGNDRLFGGDGSDYIDAGLGDDTIYGDAGDDAVAGQDGNDQIYGGLGSDVLSGDAGNDLLYGDEGDDLVLGGAGDDTVYGGADNDLLDGDAGNDFLDGGLGDDNLAGGLGDDSLTGGAGNDFFSYNPGDGADTISDFNTGADFIDLSAFYDDIWELQADQADDGLLNQSNTLTTNGKVVDYTNNAQFGTGGSLSFTGATATGSFFNFDNTAVVCFAAGTQIETEAGEVAVETLRAGDLVSTLDHGRQPIRWIARRDLGAQDLQRHQNFRPIHIAVGALGKGCPAQDLLVSPQHRMLVSSNIALRMFDSRQVLIAAKHLVGINGIEVAHDLTQVSYFHILFDRHEVIFANQTASESLYTGRKR